MWNITSRVENSELPQARETPSGKERIQNCDFSRCRLNVRVKALASNLCSEATNMLYLSKEGCALAGEEILFIAEGFGESPEGFGFLWSCFLKD